MEENIKGFNHSLDKLRNSMDDFNSYTTTFRSSTQERLDGFNSDFISKMDDVLKSMNNDVNQDLLEEMEQLHQEGKAIYDTMKMLDEEAAKAIGGDQS